MGVFKRSVGKAKKAVKKRYGLNKKSKAPNVGRMAADVAKLAMMINAEKKAYNVTYSNQNVGQCNINTTGALCYDITPLIPQDATASGRNGASVKLHSALYQFQFAQLTGLNINQKIIIEFWINKGTTLDVATLQPYLHDTATFSGVIDTNSPRNQDHYSEYVCIRKIVKNIPADSTSGNASVITFQVPMKFNRGKGHHIRLVQSLSNNYINDVRNGQLIMTVRASVGNANGATATTTRDVPLTAPTTGSQMRFAYRTWYYDN